MHNTNAELLASVSRRAKRYLMWRDVLYWQHTWYTAIANICAAAVPFGLAALLYVPELQRRPLNIGLLIVSGTGLALQMILLTIRLSQRAKRLAKIGGDLDVAYYQFTTGTISVEQLLDVYKETHDIHADEET